MSGVFISFEGGEGLGKSVQASRLADDLRARGREVVHTREPGGTPAGERIRDVVLHARDVALSPMEKLKMSDWSGPTATQGLSSKSDPLWLSVVVVTFVPPLPPVQVLPPLSE